MMKPVSLSGDLEKNILIRYPKISRSDHLSRNWILYVPEKNNLLNTKFVYLLSFM